MRQPQASTVIRGHGIVLLFLAAALCVVYAQPSIIPPVKAEKPASETVAAPNGGLEILRDISILPAQVARMRSEMLTAAMSGELAALRIPVEMNEIPPMLAKEKVPDPVDYWKKTSGDGQGREIMAVIVELFRTGFVRKAGAGTANDMYIWPYFAELPLDKLTPAQEVELLTLVTPERLKAMRATGKYDHYQIGISGDGVWHFFWNGVH
jgi:hypothetical protein